VPFRAALTLVLLCALAPWAPSRAAAQAADGGAAPAAEIHQTITRQIEAFRRDDAETAFALAAPAIQRLFGDPERFMAMVAQDYRPVFRSRRIAFDGLFRQGEEMVQKVVITGPDGVPVVALYRLERDETGAWRINGCVLLSPEESPI
jgi:hypothetical protein